MIVKAVNLILARGLDHLQFRQFLSDTLAEFQDLRTAAIFDGLVVKKCYTE